MSIRRDDFLTDISVMIERYLQEAEKQASVEKHNVYSAVCFGLKEARNVFLKHYPEVFGKSFPGRTGAVTDAEIIQLLRGSAFRAFRELSYMTIEEAAKVWGIEESELVKVESGESDSKWIPPGWVTL